MNRKQKLPVSIGMVCLWGPFAWMASDAAAVPCTANPIPGLVTNVSCDLNETPNSFTLDITSSAPIVMSEFLNNFAFGTHWRFEVDLVLENGPVVGGPAQDRVAIFGTVFHPFHPPGDPLAPGGASQVFGFSFVLPAQGALTLPAPDPLFRNHQGHRDRYFEFAGVGGRNPGSPPTQIDSWSFHMRGEHERLAVPVPEPSTLFLLGSGLVGHAAFRRKRLFKKSEKP